MAVGKPKPPRNACVETRKAGMSRVRVKASPTEGITQTRTMLIVPHVIFLDDRYWLKMFIG